MRAFERTAQLPQRTARLLHPRILSIHTEYPQHCVVHGGTEYAALALNVQTPAAVLGMRAREEVVLDFDCALGGDRCVGDIPGDDEAREQEHGAAILAGPVAGG